MGVPTYYDNKGQLRLRETNEAVDQQKSDRGGWIYYSIQSGRVVASEGEVLTSELRHVYPHVGRSEPMLDISVFATTSYADDYDVFKYYYMRKSQPSCRKHGEEWGGYHNGHVYDVETKRDIPFKTKYGRFSTMTSEERQALIGTGDIVFGKNYYDLIKADKRKCSNGSILYNYNYEDGAIYYGENGRAVFHLGDVSEYLLFDERFAPIKEIDELRRCIIENGINVPKNIELPFGRDEQFYEDLQRGICAKQRRIASSSGTTLSGVNYY